MTNSVSFDSFFTEIITDNNGISGTDINAGLKNLYEFFNENANSLEEVQNYLVGEIEEGYPDLVAKRSVLGSQDYWWWILLLNRLDNPLEDIKYNWVYSINSSEQINNFIENSNNNNETKADSRLGSIVELN